MNDQNQRFVRLFWWLETNLSRTKIFAASHCKWINLSKVLSNYLGNLKYVCHRQHFYKITLQMNYSKYSFVEQFWSYSVYNSISIISTKLHYEWMILTKVPSNYVSNFDKISYYQTFLQNHTTNEWF